MKIAAVVILYYPPQDVLSNIKSYYNQVDKIYVFDNTDKETYIKEALIQLPKVEFYHDYKNEGISKRLNSAAKLAIENNYNWLLTMDQDTCFSNEAIESYFKCFNDYPHKELVSMFGTEYTNKKSLVLPKCQPEEAENLITSGMLLNLNLFTKIGLFDEKLFIDSVDHDYCIRAKLLGFLTIKFANIRIQHNLGEEVFRSSIKSLFLIRKKKVIHSPLRCYYMYRNMLYLEKKFKGTDVYLSYNLRKIVTGNLKASIFYGGKMAKVLKYLFLAKKDFKNDRMGKMV
jgi:rhamnosyltransferase